MQALLIEGTFRTPRVVFDPSIAYIEISGKSLLEDHEKFFRSFFRRLDSYSKSPVTITKVKIDLDFFDSRSSKVLLKILSYLKVIVNSNNIVEFDWYYADEDVLEIIEDYKTFVNFEINMFFKEN